MNSEAQQQHEERRNELLQSEQSVYQTVWFPGGCTSFPGSSEEIFRRQKSGISSGTCEQTEPEHLKWGLKEEHTAAPEGLSAAAESNSSWTWLWLDSGQSYRAKLVEQFTCLGFQGFGFDLWEHSIRATERLDWSQTGFWWLANSCWVWSK